MRSEERFSEKLFRNPTKEYRGAPFWAWNGELDKNVLKEQMDVLKEMGFGGFHIHSRIGLSTEYLGKEFMDCVEFCNSYGKEQDMLTWLYDEDKWPSGYGGGFVTEQIDYRARYLLFSPNQYKEEHLERKRPPQSRLTEDGDLTLLARYRVQIEDGKLASYCLLKEEEVSDEQTWYAYQVIEDKLPWFNNAAYVDTMNPDATRRFIDKVYEKYKQCLGKEFSKSVPAIFTDEPQFTKAQPLANGKVFQDAGIPYTKDLEDVFQEAYGYRLFDKLPELFWEKADGTLSETKYQYHNLIAQRFADAYAGVLGEWCEENNLMLTGHLMYEDNLERQTQCVGDAMRSYIYFQQPGIDILADSREYNTAKQVQSVVHQEGKPGITSELYGVTNWDYDFRGHKLQGDWQAALGITTRVPHLAWMYMGGESKRDYPAPIDAHSPWYEKYSVIEDHFARINTVLQRGQAHVRVAVIHPIESYWMLFGPVYQTLDKRKRMDENFAELTEWLLFNLIDFDFLSEGLLPKQRVTVEHGVLHVGEMSYEAIVVPKLLTIRRSTLNILKQFQAEGGKVILLGDVPAYVDAKQSPDAAELAVKAVKTGFDKEEILHELEPFRDIDIKTVQGVRSDCLIYQMRKENADKWLFVAHGKPEEEVEANPFLQQNGNELEFRVHGSYTVQLLDSMTGNIQTISSHREKGITCFSLPCYAQDSFLLRLTASEEDVSFDRDAKHKERHAVENYLPWENSYCLEESNVLLLDQAAWRLDEGAWMPTEEILKLDDQVRSVCGWRLRTDSFPQPWLTKGENRKEHLLSLRYMIHSEIALDSVELAFEGDSDVKIWWNDTAVFWEEGQSFVDRTIHRIQLGALRNGENVLCMQIPMGVNTNLEWSYLLGDFGVRLFGRNAVITERPVKIGFGDYTSQGFPFYGGNFVYEIVLDTKAGEIELEVPNYAAALLGVSLDEGEEQPLFMSPYRINLGEVEEGQHKLCIRAYGNRFNQFGQVHNCNLAERYFGPKTWRTEGKNWCYEYRLKPNGVLTAPIIRCYRTGE